MASKFVNLGQHNDPSLNSCNEKSPIAGNLIENPVKQCGEELPNDWLQNLGNKKIGFGQAVMCDPMQTGQIINEINNPNRNVVYRYSKSIRAADEATMDLFKNIVVIDDDGKAHPVPIIWATQERAVAAMLQDNVRKDNSLVVDRIKLPIMSIYSNNFQFNPDRYIYHKAIDYNRRMRPDNKPGFTENEHKERDTVFGVARGIPVDITYTLYAWTMYVEDMNQILEQIFTKFSPIAYIRVRGVPWETIVKLDSTANNIDVEPGDQNLRVIKYEFNLTVETYIPQPIVRKKSVLGTRINIFNDIESKNVTEVIDRVEDTVKDS